MGDWTGTVPTHTAGAKIRGVDEDTQDDVLTAAVTAWTSYAVTWTSSGTQPTIGNGTLAGYYRRLGKTVDVRVRWNAGGTTGFGTGTYLFSLPFTAHANAVSTVGACRIFDSGTATRAAIAFIHSALAAIQMVQGIADVTNTSPQTFANGDEINISLTYEAA